MKFKIIIVAIVLSALLAACSGENNDESATDNGTVDIKELVQEYSVGEKVDEIASITSKQLIVMDDDGNETSTYDLPEDEFFVSIAPFISQTHPCTDHSLTGCQGELVNEDFDLYIEDEDGNVILDEKMTSGSNGFVDLWLPRDKTYNVSITHEGKEVESEISTFKKDGTCITTMQLI